MLQHFSQKYSAYVQHVQNNSTDLVVRTTTSVSYRNMIQMGEKPLNWHKKKNKKIANKHGILNLTDERREEEV